jgi:hypothetical protein
MGLKHGAYCVGCCWMFMALLFVPGVMNLFWVAAYAARKPARQPLPFIGLRLRQGLPLASVKAQIPKTTTAFSKRWVPLSR